MIRRAGVMACVAAVLLGLHGLDEPHSSTSSSASVATAAMGRLGSSIDQDAPSSTWFCPAAGAGTEPAPVHQVIISNTGEPTTAKVTGYRSGSNQTASIEVALDRSSQAVVVATDIAPDVLGVSVEIDGPAGSVAHRLVASTASDQSDCLINASDEWHFPSASTELGKSAQLWLLNPFPTDASIDVSVVTEEGVRIPKALRGLIIPAASSRMVDVGEAGQRRVQFAFSVVAHGGRVLAELAQTVAGSGLRLQPGIAAAEPAWLFADSFGGAGVSDQLVVYNPGAVDVPVAVSVFPDGYDTGSLPEPFLLDVPARRYATVQLDKEPRVPPDGRRWVQVEALAGATGRIGGVVAIEVTSIEGPGGDGTVDTRPTVAGGLASSTGSPIGATDWTVTAVDGPAESQSAVVVVNPSADTIALVTVSSVSNGTRSPALAQPIEVAPLGALPIDVTGAATAGLASVVVSSPTPIVVAARTTSTSRVDFSAWPALPWVPTASSLSPLAGR